MSGVRIPHRAQIPLRVLFDTAFPCAYRRGTYMPPTFHTSFGLELSLPQVVREIVRFITADPTRRYKVTIGTDSEQSQSRMADFVTAIVVHRVGNGGRYFWRRTKLGKFHTLRDRIIKEVLSRSSRSSAPRRNTLIGALRFTQMSARTARPRCSSRRWWG